VKRQLALPFVAGSGHYNINRWDVWASGQAGSNGNADYVGEDKWNSLCRW
jgi:hypothetical protein